MAEELDRERFFHDWFAEWAPSPPRFGWATELLVHATGDDPAVAWDLILALIARAQNEDLLSCVAAGPLEDLLCNHGSAFIDRVETLAVSDVRFRKCLAGVWGFTRMEPSIHQRICKAAGK